MTATLNGIRLIVWRSVVTSFGVFFNVLVFDGHAHFADGDNQIAHLDIVSVVGINDEHVASLVPTVLHLNERTYQVVVGLSSSIS